MSQRGWDNFHANPYELYDYGQYILTEFTDGGVANMGDGYWGWEGLGGSLFQWNQDLGISFSYVPSDLLPMQMNVRGNFLRSIVKDCVKRMDDGDRSGRKGDKDDRKGEKDGKKGDDFIDWSEDKDRIIMTGADGSMLYIEMAAAKIAASLSVTAIAAMTLW